jgi:hypothetical protein
MPGAHLGFQQRLGGGVEWVRTEPGRVTRLDVQHDLVGVDWCRQAFRIDPDALWEVARPLKLEGVCTWQLSVEDTLIHLCLHPAVNHGYACSLIGYVDMDRVIRCAGADLSWERLVERAQRFGVETIVYQGLQRTRHLVGTVVPDEVLSTLRPGNLQRRAMRRLIPVDMEHILQGPARRPSGVTQLLIHAVLADRMRDVWAMVWSILFPEREWLSLRYSLGDQDRTWWWRVKHLFRLARAVYRGLRKPLTQSGLD